MLKQIGSFGLAVVLLATSLITAPPVARAEGFGVISRVPLVGPCSYFPVLGIDTSTGHVSGCGSNSVWASPAKLIGAFQGTTATSITTTSFTTLTGPSILLKGGSVNYAGKTIRVQGKGVYTTAAASLLGARVALCQTSAACGGTVVAPAGCSVISTNQANVLANAQFTFECVFVIASTGASGTAMAKATAAFNLGAATSAALSVFADTATAVSAAVDFTVDEYVSPQFQFATSNAGNGATIQEMTVETLN